MLEKPKVVPPSPTTNKDAGRVMGLKKPMRKSATGKPLVPPGPVSYQRKFDSALTPLRGITGSSVWSNSQRTRDAPVRPLKDAIPACQGAT